MTFDTQKLGSWKTTAMGVLSAFAGFVAFSPQLFSGHPWVMELSKYIMVGGLASIGIFAKDSNVTGGGANATVAPGSIPDAALHAQTAPMTAPKL